MSESYQVIIIGSGFGGICAALNLQQQGISNFIMLERRNFVGGTWVQNTYPGAAVDVPSPLYSIFSEPYNWSRMYAGQSELETYTNHIIDKNGLREKTKLNSNVKAMRWQEEQQQWLIEVNETEQYTAQFVVNASGPLSTPIIPEFDGAQSYQGDSFHTNDWNHDVDYRGKKVAVIGSGASAAQVIPAIAEDVAELHVYQRVPHWVMPRPDYQFSAWQGKLLTNKFCHRLLRRLLYWQHEVRFIAFKHMTGILDKFARNRAIDFIEQQIADPILRQQVTPDYTPGCKRIILSSTLYPAYCRDNVSLNTNGIKQLNPTGIVDGNGNATDVDIIVYSTGFDAVEGMISYPVYGEGEKKLQDVWQDYPHAYLGATVPSFPNLFIVTGPNTGIGHTSAIFIIEAQLLYIMRCIKEVVGKSANSIAVLDQAELNYNNHIHSEMEQTVWQTGGCNSWYKSKSGKVVSIFPGFSFMFRRLANKFNSSHHVIK